VRMQGSNQSTSAQGFSRVIFAHCQQHAPCASHSLPSFVVSMLGTRDFASDADFSLSTFTSVSAGGLAVAALSSKAGTFARPPFAASTPDVWTADRFPNFSPSLALPSFFLFASRFAR